MKKFLLIFAGIIGFMMIFFLVNPKYSQKRKALGEAGKTLVTADHHHVLVAEGGKRLLEADFNLAVITRANTYIANIGSNTTVFQEIARVAAEADHECERLEAVLDLAVMSTSEAGRILALAESACHVAVEDQEAAWQEAYDFMLTRAEYPSVEVAEESQMGH